MTVYVGATIGTTGIVRLPACFTGWHARIIHSLLMLTDALVMAAIGAVIGFVVSWALGPEVASKLIGSIGGALVGGMAGSAVAAIFLSMSMCPCPPGSNGFCIFFVFYVVPGTTVALPIWPFFVPGPGLCPTLVPPGCP